MTRYGPKLQGCFLLTPLDATFLSFLPATKYNPPYYPPTLTMPSTDSLLKIHDMASDIRAMFQQFAKPEAGSSSFSHLPPLGLVLPAMEDLVEDLSKFNISSDCQHALISIYDKQLRQLRDLYQEVYEKAISELHGPKGLDESYHDSFRSLLRRNFSVQSRSSWQAIHKEVKQYQNAHRAFEGFDGSLALDADEQAFKSNRGHNPDAVRILEQAFEHTPNITQAEKYRLAEVTGLKPKQVTIWVSS